MKTAIEALEQVLIINEEVLESTQFENHFRKISLLTKLDEMIELIELQVEQEAFDDVELLDRLEEIKNKVGEYDD